MFFSISLIDNILFSVIAQNDTTPKYAKNVLSGFSISYLTDLRVSCNQHGDR